MVIYNICYDVAAFVMLLVITLLFWLKRGIRNYQNRLYFCLVFCALLGTAADVVDVLFMNATAVIPIWMKYTSSGACFVFQGLEALLVMFYFMGITNSWWKTKKAVKFALAIPYVIIVALIATTYFTQFIFYYDQNGIYVRGKLCILTYLIAFIYLSIACAHIWHLRRYLTMDSKIILTVLTIIAIAGMLIQSLVPGMLTQMFASALCLFIIFFTLQNPYLAIDNYLRVYNRSSFMNMTSIDFASGKKLSMILITISDYSFLQSSMGTEPMQALLRKIIKELKALDRDLLVYHINDACFCIVLNERYREKTIQSIMTKLGNMFEKPWRINDITTILSVNLCRIECPKDTDNVEGIFDIVSCMLDQKQEEKILCVKNMDISGRNLQRKREQAIKEAILAGDYDLCFRKLSPIAEDKSDKVELTLRIPDGEGGFVYSGECKTFLEKAGLILQVGNCLFKEACIFVNERNACGEEITGVEIGISIFLCIQQEYLDDVITMMKEYGIKPGTIRLKISESEAMDCSRQLQEMMQLFDLAGVGFALDGYGTGYSNISYIYELPFSHIEMEEKVFMAALTDGKAMDILKNSIHMLHELEMQVVISNLPKEHFALAKELGCDYVVGPYSSGLYFQQEVSDAL